MTCDIAKYSLEALYKKPNVIYDDRGVADIRPPTFKMLYRLERVDRDKRTIITNLSMKQITKRDARVAFRIFKECIVIELT